jgi:hypothetical protein
MNDIRQIRIFVPRDPLFLHSLWAETVMGHVIMPIVTQYNSHLAWFWLSRYDCPKEMDSDDCDISQIPLEFMDPQNNHYRSIRFRYSVTHSERTGLEVACRTLIYQYNCAKSDFLDYSVVGDLGNDRHTEEPRTPQRRQERAQLVVENYYSIAKLILHALIGPDSNNRFCLPHHHSLDPQQETPFRVFHHIFCNATDVPLYVTALHHGPGVPWNPPEQVAIAHRVYF